MENIFIKDVWSVILAKCNSRTLARISLCCKPAIREIWFLAPLLQIEGITPRQFKNSIQFTSLNLRQVSLTTLREFPLIIRHLADNCPRMHSFTMISTALETFTSCLPDLARLVDRLTKLRIVPPKNRLIEKLQLSQKLLDNFNTLFQSLKQPETLTSMELSFAPPGSDSIQILASALGRLVNLRSVAIALNPATTNSGLIFSECRNLRKVELGAFRRGVLIRTMETFVKTLLKALSQSQVKGNITATNGTQFLYDACLQACGVPLSTLFGWLNECEFVGPLPGNSISKLLCYHTSKPDPSALLYLIDLVSSEDAGRPKWFPPMRDVVPKLREFWASLFLYKPTQMIRTIVSSLGKPQVPDRDLVWAAVTSCQLDTMKYLEELGIFTRENLLGFKPKSIFSQVKSVEVLRHLFQFLSKEDARPLLLERRNANMSVLFDCSFDATALLDACLEWDPSLFCMTNERDIVSFALYLSKYPTIDRLKRFIEATGLPNISGVARAASLLACAVSRGLETVSKFWIELIQSDPTVEPLFLAPAQTDRGQSELSVALRIASQEIDGTFLGSVLVKFKDTLIRQIAQIDSADAAADLAAQFFTFLCKLECAIAEEYVQNPEAPQVCQSITSDIFIPVCSRAV
eukprot:TRINITY_DN1805_c0_g2_i1.p1 TRINITY_DN1805_c0_g2~~TRINITY_DN1805_c0_g2_i1.p1  ORF type:complete len:634 (-),score=64.58 TRINITY_DN1805_c0_g2_i1:31-1932(-)